MEISNLHMLFTATAYMSVVFLHAILCLNQLHHAKLLSECRAKDVKNVSKKIAQDSIRQLKLSLVWPVVILKFFVKSYKDVKWFRQL